MKRGVKVYNSQLKTFVYAVDSGSFSKATERLYISSTAVMKQINALEAHLELKLIERNNQGISLTSAGESVYKDAKFLFDYSEKAVARARQISKRRRSVFVLVRLYLTHVNRLWSYGIV